MKTDQPNPTYQERAVALRRDAAVVSLQDVNSDYSEFLKATEGIKDNTIASANKAREIGIKLQSLCQHEMMSEEFWKSNCQGKTKFDFETAKIFISTARKMPKPATNLKEAAPFIQTMLIAGDLLQLPERTGPQNPNPLSPVQRFFNEFTLMKAPWKKITREKPIEKWDEASLKRVLSETQWVAEIRQKAEQLLKG